jgi:CheY-like chemotaxis protein
MANQRSSAEASREPPPIARPRRIVIVEDNDDVREVLRVVLELMGHRVASAGDGERGYATIREFRPEIALIDLGLPILDGYELAARVRADDPHTRLIALTGYGQPEQRRRALAAGFALLLVKPLDPDTLPDVFDRIDGLPAK